MLKVSNSLHLSNQRDLRFGQASGGWRLRWNSELCSGRVEFPRPRIHSDRRRTQHASGSALRLAEETQIKKIRKVVYINKSTFNYFCSVCLCKKHKRY